MVMDRFLVFCFCLLLRLCNPCSDHDKQDDRGSTNQRRTRNLFRDDAATYDNATTTSTTSGRHLSSSYTRLPCRTRSPTIWEKGAMGMAYGAWMQENGFGQSRSLQARHLQVKYTIPVHFHAYAADASVGQLLVSHQTEFINAVNTAFAGSAFQFEAKNLTNIINPKGWLCSGLDSLARLNRVAGTDVLNVYTCDMNSIGSFGRGTFPPNVLLKDKKDIDGVFIIHPDIGRNGPLEVYKAFAHEVGHWLGLLHTFESGCKTTVSAKFGFTKFPSWVFDGDGVNDTPAQARPSWDFAGYETCFATVNQDLDSCTDTPGIDPGKDPNRNYMNYIHENCMTEFTAGQQARMLSQYETFRKALEADQAKVARCAKRLKKPKRGGCACDTTKPAKSAACARKFVRKKCRRTLSSNARQKKLEQVAVLGEWDKVCPQS